MNTVRFNSPRFAIGAIAVLLVPVAAYAAQVLSPPVTATGTLAAPIINATNNGTGAAVTAKAVGNAIVTTSAHQNGIVGVTLFGGATAANTGAGVIGVDNTGNANNQGVTGRSKSGTGVLAISTQNGGSGFAIRALANGSAGISSTVHGATDGSNCGRAAVSAFSPAENVVLGDSSPDNCLPYVTGLNGSAITADGGARGLVASAHQIPGKGLPSIAVVGIGDQGGRFVADNQYGVNGTALEIEQDGAGYVLTAHGTGGGMSLDNNGNLVISGTLTQNGVPGATVKPSAFSSGSAFSHGRTVATLEDVGAGRLAYGSAYIRFDPALARGIDFAQRYDVFVTPEGPSAGVYVAEKTAQGFAVHENPGGRSNVDFSYRVVAKALSVPAQATTDTQEMKRLDIKTELRALEHLRKAAQVARRQPSP
ncbi:MAG: hypothetical protein NVSMB64_08020 [Candidatus Velthaea sp.]